MRLALTGSPAGRTSMSNKLIKGRHGKFLVPENDQYVGKSLIEYGEFSYLEFELFQDIIEPHFIIGEVGANIGAHTVGLSSLVPKGRVDAFEPQSFCFYFLNYNLSINHIHNVVTHKVGLGNIEKTMYVPTPVGEVINYGGIELGHLPMSVRDETVDIRIGSDFFIDGLDFLKVDAEGMEKEVLEGMAKSIKKFRPILYVENDRVEKSLELIKTCRALGYTLYWHIPPLYNPDNYFKNKNNLFQDIYSFNMVGLFDKKINLPLVTIEHPLTWNMQL